MGGTRQHDGPQWLRHRTAMSRWDGKDMGETTLEEVARVAG